MKHKNKPGKNKLVIMSLALTVPALLIFGFFQSGEYKKLVGHDNSQTSGDKVSKIKKFTSEEELSHSAGTGIPTNNNKSLPDIGIKWTQGSVVDGNDTCFIYDKRTYQIYAEAFRTSGFNLSDTIESGTTYYKNKALSKDKAQQILEQYCYK